MNPAAAETDRDPDRRAEPTRCVPSGFLATVWWKLAPVPDGTCRVRGSGWCQDLGSFNLPWETLPCRAACIDRMREAATALLNSVPQRPLEHIQEKARDDLLRELTALGLSLFN